MDVLPANAAALGYLVAAVCFILALKGLSSPATARKANLLGAAGAVLACVVVFLSQDLDHVVPILVATAVGTVIGVPAARRVAMTEMPQLVALFNGVGGAAAALVAALELTGDGVLSGSGPSTRIAAAAGAFTVLVGGVSFAGSCVTFAKLHELMTTRPVVLPGAPFLFGGSVLAGVVLSAAVVASARDTT
ncbi:MAG: NAD(P)(+) transhydrogenase (Re/Si-specific) subunit beta, partial [Actinomycetes bacterium]